MGLEHWIALLKKGNSCDSSSGNHRVEKCEVPFHISSASRQPSSNANGCIVFSFPRTDANPWRQWPSISTRLPERVGSLIIFLGSASCLTHKIYDGERGWSRSCSTRQFGNVTNSPVSASLEARMMQTPSASGMMFRIEDGIFYQFQRTSPI